MQDCHITVPETATELGVSIGLVHFDRGFAHEERVCQIFSKAAKNGAKAMQSGNRTGHAGQCKQ